MQKRAWDRVAAGTSASGSKPSTVAAEAEATAESAGPPQAQGEQSAQNEQTRSSDSRLTVSEEIGDLFDAPSNAVLIHACNTYGAWGAGIAKAFRDRYPRAFRIYKSYCEQHGASLVGTALLIPPVDDDEGSSKHWIGCLFTSRAFGARKDKPAAILRNTKPAMEDLLQKIAMKKREGNDAGEVRMCRINAGLFGIPWEETKGVLEEIEVVNGLTAEVICFSME